MLFCFLVVIVKFCFAVWLLCVMLFYVVFCVVINCLVWLFRFFSGFLIFLLFCVVFCFAMFYFFPITSVLFALLKISAGYFLQD